MLLGLAAAAHRAVLGEPARRVGDWRGEAGATLEVRLEDTHAATFTFARVE